MKFQVSALGWPLGAVLIPPSIIVDCVNNPNGQWEQICAGKVPGPDCLALDADCAAAQWVAFPHLRRKLVRQLHWVQEELYQRIIRDPLLLAYYIPKPQPAPAPPITPKFDFATALARAIQWKESANARRP
jgi:hypothetical protein